MAQKDHDNITFLADEEKVYSKQGEQFHREKYLPTLTRVKKYLSSNATQALDVGIGYGSFMKMTEEVLKLQSHGLDPFPDSIAIAREHTQAPIYLGRIEDFPWNVKGRFDFISCLDVTEHLEDPGLFYSHAKKHLSMDGIILMTTPLRLLPYEMRSLPIIGIPDKNTTHINVQAPSYWDDLAKEHGYVILESWRGEHLTHVKYISGIFRRICKSTGLDPRKTPIISSFQQAYNQILKLK